MSKRRPAGDGMIRTRQDGRKEGRLVIGHKHDRTSIFLYFSDPTEAGLMAKQEMYKQLYKGVNLCEESDQPLENWLDRWLEEFAAPAVRPTTLEGYRNDLNNYVKPYLGKKPIRKITTADIQKLYREVQEHGRVKEHPEYGYALSASTIRSLHGVLHQSMEAAEKIDREITGSKKTRKGSSKKNVEPQKFEPVKGQRRRPGTGCVSQIGENLWEGRYSPRWPDGTKHVRDVYASTEEECEAKLEELIAEMNAERAAWRKAHKAA